MVNRPCKARTSHGLSDIAASVRKLSWRSHQDCLNLKHDFLEWHTQEFALK
jgi:hypothetical protein